MAKAKQGSNSLRLASLNNPVDFGNYKGSWSLVAWLWDYSEQG